MPLAIYKPISFTPLQALDALRRAKPELAKAKLAYAGRLDPLAHGLLLVLVDEECLRRDEFQNLDKEYEFEMLLGVATDSYDLMGIFTGDITVPEADLTVELEKLLPQYTGRITQTLPAYSSHTIGGKKLFSLTKAGELDAAELPTKEIEITELKLISTKKLTGHQIAETAIERVSRVKGDFRQQEIIDQWNSFAEKYRQQEFPILKLRAKVASGTYIRSLIHELGQKLGSQAAAFDIFRGKVGDFELVG